ncbi:polysaccharide ABC transporter ATP-binding protein [Turneriella parva]|uniref:ABC transporter related protein n=1 Tax=Turneriella parva (strain ATCC BAA-1111 / DSM 21527 / NCTC 11395 / H) TaxID=869212 RepID=I4B117_TURPD|nr:polysaccharide ABC transporter ATP-binding protein [Turneriella parva]AFM10974.1 ABC transporter related protein [Turneriella parva DSM 21527]
MSTVIKVENLSKSYRLGNISTGSLHKDLQSFWARLRSKEDPNRRIGEKVHHTKDELFWALKDVSFEVRQGDIVGIIGRNGAGKSTLLKILSRITAPTTGSLKVRGRIASLLEVGTGFHPELTGRENVYLNGAILGMTRREIDRKFDEIVDFAEVEQFIDTPVKRYSSGMYVRLAFAVAAHLESEILIVDEVLAVGDVQFQKKCLGKMQEVGRKGRTVLFVSHNIGALKQMCTVGLHIHAGRTQKFGTLPEALSEYFQYNDTSAGPSSSVQWDEDKAPGDGCIRIRKMHVSGSFQIADTFSINSDLVVRLELDILRNKTRPLIALLLLTNDEQEIFSTLSQNYEDYEDAFLEPGRYSILVTIPAGILNSTEYRIRINVFNSFWQNFAFRVPIDLRFTTYDDGRRRRDYNGNYGGVIRPTLQWDLQRQKSFTEGRP